MDEKQNHDFGLVPDSRRGVEKEISKLQTDGVQSTPLKVLDRLADLGFKNTFQIKDGELHCVESEQSFPPENLLLKGAYRFEGPSNPDDMSIVYALETTDGTRGIIMDAFGVRANRAISEFMGRVQDDRGTALLADFPSDKEIVISVTRTAGK
jgi:hypothetical protein